jgi:hypothetical protein
MPLIEYVVGLDCDLSNVNDTAVEEAVESFASHLRDDNEHERPLQHLVDLLGPAAPAVRAVVAIEGESGPYVLALQDGKIQRASGARFQALRDAGIVVRNPRAELHAKDPLLEGRPRQKLEAIDAAKRGDAPRLLRALAHPSNARGASGAAEIRRRIFTVLTRIGGVEAEQALIDALSREDNDVIDPVIDCFVRLPELMRRLPDVLLAAWQAKQALVARRLLRLATDLELSDEWLARVPSDLAAAVRQRRR